MALTVAGLEHNLLCRLTLGEDGSLRHAQQTLPQPQKRTTTTGIVMALPVDDLIRRQLPKPFQRRRQLWRIAPAMTEDTLLEGEASKARVIHVNTEGLSPSLFTAFAVDTATAQKRAEELGNYMSRVRQTVPVPFGLSYYAPAGKAVIIICARSHDVLAVLIGADGGLIDFRTTPTDKWRHECALCLRTWAPHCTDENAVYTIGDVSFPSKLDVKAQPVTLPDTITPDLAPLYGIAKRYHAQDRQMPNLYVADRALIQQRHAVADRLFRVAVVLLLASAAIGGILMYRKHMAAEQTAAYASAISNVFADVMPNVPEVDPLVQVSKRLSQLRLFMGQDNGAAHGQSILDTLATIDKEARAADMNLRVERMEITMGKIILQGTLSSFADVDDLQNRLSKALNRTFELKNAQNKDGVVQFQLEAGA
ncbi:MAG: hypothetical protein GC134_02180 [Proteobacteria bacterium]|nr:hypothetical protein [Pseudomonadota bacterium]